MASIVIRNIDDDLKARLRQRAYRRCRSMEEEAREILRGALATEIRTGLDFWRSVQHRFAGLEDVWFSIARRGAAAAADGAQEPPTFG
ncbi:plasmid stabilization protein [Ferrovibrio sp.]|uniref:FitA-like ribbon-helix-helix domain-containing protein n=1 Tax=Ferrovibrio sp. TaxID=1917215 RepID=UPI002616D5AA|nr:plasmid stabilization protein [Ferrovibrio sp.]